MSEEIDYVRLCKAIELKKKQSATYLISRNVEVNNSEIQANTPLHWAIIQFEDLDIMTMLIDKGADINAYNHCGQKPLDVAIELSRANATNLLIEKGALVGEDLNKLLIKVVEKESAEIVTIIIDYVLHNRLSVNFKKPLNIAINRGMTQIIELIIPHCRYLKQSEKYIPCHLVTDYKDANCVKLLLKWNFTIDPTAHLNNEFISSSIKNGYLPIVLRLLKRGINVNIKDRESGLTLLQIACICRYSEIVENLLNHRAAINVIKVNRREVLNKWYVPYFHLQVIPNNYEGKTCLHIAVDNNDPVTVKNLLKHGAQIMDDPTYFKITGVAIQNNYQEIVSIFLDFGIDAYESDSEGKTYLHYCVSSCSYKSRYKIAKMFLERGADIHVRAPGSSLLFEAIKYHHRDIADLFLSNRGDVNYTSLKGNTPLHIAMANNFDVQFIKDLLEKGANPNTANHKGRTPLHIICESSSNKYHHREAYSNNITQKIELLLQNNANIEAIDFIGRTPLFSACNKANFEAVKCLLNHHANVNHTDLNGLSTLYIAAKKSNESSDIEIIEFLLKHKANIHCMDKLKKSLIHVAVERRNKELIKQLAYTQVNFNSVNLKGNTPLHTAVDDESSDVTDILIKYGANVNILNRQKKTPLQSAIDLKISMQRKLSKYRHHFGGEGSFSDSSDDSACDFESHLTNFNKCMKKIQNLKIHVIKLKVAGLKVHKQNFYVVYESPHRNYDYDMNGAMYRLRLEINCAKEIQMIKMHKVDSNITLYDLLKKNIHYLTKFVKNREIRKTLELPVYDAIYPLYIDIIRNRFQDAKFRYRLMDSAKNYFNNNIYLLTDDCLDCIFSYLKIKEIKMVIRAFKPFNV